MTSQRARVDAPRGDGAPGKSPGVLKTVLSDIRQGELRRTLRRDLQDLSEFYLEDEARARLKRMPRLHRFFFWTGWLLKQLILKLPPIRRLLLVSALLLFVIGGMSFHQGNVRIDLGGNPVSFVILLVVLMLELKDKLLARREIEVGRAVQQALLPDTNPTLAGWDIWMFTRPANDVGGDLVDYLSLRGERLGVALGDVAGKGLGAALLMARLQATLRAFAPDSESLAVLGARMNAILGRENPKQQFATLVYFELEPGSGEVRLLNAGHPLPILLRAAEVQQLPPVALPLGLMTGSAYSEQRFTIAPGDMLIVYSDGLTEAETRAHDLFGEERLLQLLPQLRGLEAEAAGTRLLAEVQRFVADQPQSDDLSLILARRIS